MQWYCDNVERVIKEQQLLDYFYPGVEFVNLDEKSNAQIIVIFYPGEYLINEQTGKTITLSEQYNVKVEFPYNWGKGSAVSARIVEDNGSVRPLKGPHVLSGNMMCLSNNHTWPPKTTAVTILRAVTAWLASHDNWKISGQWRQFHLE